MYRRLAMMIAVIMITGLLAGPAASADDNSCWLQAEQGLYLAVYDLDSLGSILSLMWEGVLEQGNKKLMKSSNGKKASITIIQNRGKIRKEAGKKKKEGLSEKPV